MATTGFLLCTDVGCVAAAMSREAGPGLTGVGDNVCCGYVGEGFTMIEAVKGLAALAGTQLAASGDLPLGEYGETLRRGVNRPSFGCMVGVETRRWEEDGRVADWGVEG